MVYRFELLTPYLIVIVSLPSREFNFPIQIRQWCQMQIGVFPFGVHPDGFPCFLFDFFGVQHHRDFEHDFTFSKLRKDLQTRIWDPGVSNYKTDNGGLRPWPSHIYGNLFLFVSEIGILVLPPLKTSMILDSDFGILFNMLLISSGIWEMLFESKTRVINYRLVNVITLPQSDQIFVSVYVQIGFSGIAMSRLYVGLVNSLRQVLFEIAHICWLRKALEMYRWEYDMTIIPFWAQISGITLLYLSNDTARNFCTNCGSLNHDVNECDLSLDNGNNDDFDLPDDDDPNEGNGVISVGMSDTNTMHTIEPFGEISGVGRVRGLPRPNVKHGRVLLSMVMWVISSGTIRRLCKVTTFILMRMKKMEFNGLGNNTASLRIRKYFGYRRHDPEPLQAAYRSICLIRVMRKEFRSFIYKMIALYKYMRRGLNRFYLLPVRLLLESRVTSTSSSKLGFNFLYLFHWLYSNGFLYHVSCKLFMK